MKNLLLILLLANISLFGVSHAHAQMEMFSEPWIEVYLDTAICMGEVDDVMLFSYAQARYGGGGRDVSFRFAWPSNDMRCHELDDSSLWDWWDSGDTCGVAIAVAGAVCVRAGPWGYRACMTGIAISLGCQWADF